MKTSQTVIAVLIAGLFASSVAIADDAQKMTGNAPGQRATSLNTDGTSIATYN